MSSMTCPKCNAGMQQVKVDEYTVDRCSACGGLWFDLREHEHIAESKSNVRSVDTGDPARGRQQDKKRDITCPVCHVKMLKLVVPDQPHIQYESCPACYGAYFDAGELTDFAKRTIAEQVRLFFRNFKRRSATS